MNQEITTTIMLKIIRRKEIQTKSYGDGWLKYTKPTLLIYNTQNLIIFI